MNREPGLAEAIERGLDPDQWVRCYSATWMEDGQWHTCKFADSADANAYLLVTGARERYVVGTSAPRRQVHPPMVSS